MQLIGGMGRAPLKKDVLTMVRGKFAAFVLKHIVSKEGKQHDPNP